MKKNKKINLVAKDIIMLKFKETDTISQSKRKFFAIMRKHGIKHGTKVPGGIAQSNYEWTICWQLFLSRIEDCFRMGQIFGGVPKDLECY